MNNRTYPQSAAIPGPRDPYLTPYIVAAERAVAECTSKRIVMMTASQSGKALDLDTPIATPSGWTTMGALRAGDIVFDEQGKQTRVVTALPVQYERDCFAVDFCDGSTIVADADHLWATVVHRWARDGGGDVALVRTGEMLDAGVLLPNGSARFAVPVAAALQLPNIALPINPYFLGVWLGDGNSRTSRVTVGFDDVDEMKGLIEADGFNVSAKKWSTGWDLVVRAIDQKPGNYGRAVKKHDPHNLASQLRTLGVLGNKHVPDIYLRASIEQRMALLQGLMDTDGGVENGTSIFCSKYESLARQVLDLVVSLGFRGRIKERVQKSHAGYRYWLVKFHAYRECAPFRLSRKVDALPSRFHVKSRPYVNDLRFIRAIRPVPSVPVRCIEVDSESRLYLAGERMIPTHNTEMLLDIAGSRLDQKPAPILYVGPNKQFLTEQFEPRVMGLLDSAPTLTAKLARGKRMTKTRKMIGGVSFRLAHAGSSAALKSDPAALALVDEYDEMLTNIKGQGDPLGLVERRGDTYPDFVAVVTSTPKRGMVQFVHDEKSGLDFWAPSPSEDVYESPIWALWQEGTRHHWAWPCPHCNEFFIPRFDIVRFPDGASPSEAARDTHLECPHCGGVIEEKHKAHMNAHGRYVAPGQTVDKEGTVHGEPPESGTLSFWVSGLASPFVSFGDRVRAYLEAVAMADDAMIQTAMNAGFGELYAPGGRDVRDWQQVAARRLQYKFGEIPEQVMQLTLAVDVQKRGLFYSIRGWGERATSWQIESGELTGFTNEPEVWADLAAIMLDTYDGLHVRLALIDSGYRGDNARDDEGAPTNVAYEFCRRFPRLAKPTKGYDHLAAPVMRGHGKFTIPGRARPVELDLVRLDTDFWKSRLHERLAWPLDQAGGFHLSADATEDYCKQLVSEVRKVTPAGRAQWIRISRRNHYLDAESMNEAAGHMIAAQRIPMGMKRTGMPGGDQVPPAPKAFDPRNLMADIAGRLNR